MGHHRFLPSNHLFRKDRVSFVNSNREWGEARTPLIGTELRRQLDDMLTEYKVEDLIKRRMDKRRKKRRKDKSRKKSEDGIT